MSCKAGSTGVLFRPSEGKASGSFLKKRTKKLLLLAALARPAPTPTGPKVFLLLFFQKKKRLLDLASPGAGADNRAMDVTLDMLTLTVNGEARGFAGPMSVMGLVQALGLDIRKVAVELNREIVPRSTYAQAVLRQGDVVEIVHFIGGG